MPWFNNKTWPEADMAKLRMLWTDRNVRLSALVAEMGRTSGACIGMAHRMKLPPRGKVKLPPPTVGSRPSVQTLAERETARKLASDARKRAKAKAKASRMPPDYSKRTPRKAEIAANQPEDGPMPAQTTTDRINSLFAPLQPDEPVSGSVEPQPEPIATQPEPIATQPEPIATQPEPIATGPELVTPFFAVTETKSWQGPGVRYLDLRKHHCRAFIGQNGPAGDGFEWDAPLSCGETVLKGLSYCADHCKAYLTPNAIRKANTARWQDDEAKRKQSFIMKKRWAERQARKA